MLVRLVVAGALAAIASCARSPAVHGSAPRDHRPVIALAHGSEPEQATRRQLDRLLDEYDLAPWAFTDGVQIDEEVIPHSHPVLTLATRHLHDDLLLLSTYVHEQSHWYFMANAQGTQAAIVALEAAFPGLPVGFPDGASDHESSYEHLGVIAFEYDGLRRLVGELRARQVMEFWTTDHYRVLYRTVLDNYRPIMTVLKSHGLTPPV